MPVTVLFSTLYIVSNIDQSSLGPRLMFSMKKFKMIQVQNWSRWKFLLPLYFFKVFLREEHSRSFTGCECFYKLWVIKTWRIWLSSWIRAMFRIFRTRHLTWYFMSNLESETRILNVLPRSIFLTNHEAPRSY